MHRLSVSCLRGMRSSASVIRRRVKAVGAERIPMEVGLAPSAPHVLIAAVNLAGIVSELSPVVERREDD